MAGVWYFDTRGVATLEAGGGVQKVATLLYKPTNQLVSSYADLENKLAESGWTRLHPAQPSGTLQFHKGPACKHLITLPADVRSLLPMHMLDITVKNRDFEVRYR